MRTTPLLKNLSGIVSMILLITNVSSAGTYVGTIPIIFTVTGFNTSDPPPVQTDATITLTTNYASFDYSIAWDLPTTNLKGGPDTTFQTTLASSGVRFLTQPYAASNITPSLLINMGKISQTNNYNMQVSDRVGSFIESASEDIEDEIVDRKTILYFDDYQNGIEISLYSSSPSRRFINLNMETDNGTPLLATIAYDDSFKNMLTPIMPGDYNDDGTVDAADYTIARDAPTPIAGLLTDLNVWRDNYGATSGITSVPEPTSLASCLIALTGLFRVRRRSA